MPSSSSKRNYSSDSSKSDYNSSDEDYSSSRHKRRRRESTHYEEKRDKDQYYEKERHRRDDRERYEEKKRERYYDKERSYYGRRDFDEQNRERNYYKEQKKSQNVNKSLPLSLEEQKKKRMQIELDESVFQKVWEQVDTSNFSSNWLEEILDELVKVQHKPPEAPTKQTKLRKAKDSTAPSYHSDSNISSDEDQNKTRTTSQDDIIGPKLIATKDSHHGYGEDLMPGEGAAIASFVQQNKRIPRRGEVGLSSDQIEQFEKAGYVMSGSRHRLMNAIRMRKENQVITEEQKKMMAKLKVEERLERENRILSEFRDMAKKSGDT